MSLQPFNEDRMDEVDSLDGHAADFDWADVERSLGESRAERADAIVGASKAWKETLKFILRGNMRDPRFLKGAGLRVVAMAWVIDPSLFPDSPSLAELAEQFGCTSANIAPYTAAFTRLYGVRNRSQCHGHSNHTRKSKDEQSAQN